MKLEQEQIDREGNYRVAISVMKTLHKRGLLNDREYSKANQRLIEKYNPVWGHYPDVTEKCKARR